MSEFLDLLESLRAEDATHSRLFDDAGTSVRRGIRRDTPSYKRALAEAGELIANVYKGKVPVYRLQEAMSASDFPLLFGDILDRQLLGKYEEWPATWQRLARRGTVRDFRAVKRFAVDGAEAVLEKVPAGGEYKEAALKEAQYEYRVEKRGRRIPFLWETIVNDDLDALRDTPERLAKAARLSEERFATSLWAANTTFFSGGNGNVITGNPALDVDALETGLTVLWSQVDEDKNPIFTGQVRLVVPPQMKVTAMNIVRATQIRVASGSGTSANQLVGQNWMTDEIAEVVVNPWLPIVDQTNGATGWYLFADPSVGRPALEIGFLRGNETPALFVKSPNSMRVGGGAVAAEDGDFETDGVNYKVRHVFGGTMMEPKAAVFSNGTG
ncbi:hypothetical protein [Phytoactinopolyspora limicola]|uniref:phage major capsid protein n=1 Tax=Phytoactinopolyspora limicola TaxID=2715536 RepID=UPI00140A39A7|nr:hypothetical protein [Phytoactinopolyspora limicola]